MKILKNEIKKLIDILNENNLTTIKVKDGNYEILIEKKSGVVYANNAPQRPTNEKKLAPKTVDKTKLLTSSLVGTYYSKPGPDHKSFVTPGDKVKQGQTLCIIEAMKVMNEIKSDRDGTLNKVLIEEGEVVEFGQPLFEFQ